MRKIWSFTLLLAIGYCGPIFAQTGSSDSGPPPPSITIKGEVSLVRPSHPSDEGQHGHGAGPAVLEVRSSDGRIAHVHLCPMRFLVEKNFSPQVGDAVEIVGYRAQNPGEDQTVVAATSVRLPREGPSAAAPFQEPARLVARSGTRRQEKPLGMAT